MRISGGKWRGQRLQIPPGRIRPSAAKLLQALFDAVSARHGGSLDGMRVLDIFAGSGALGLEALSRGAAFALFLDCDRRAIAAMRANAVGLGLRAEYALRHQDIRRLGRRPDSMPPFDMALLDPPYRFGLAECALARLASGGWMRAGGYAMVEESAAAVIAPPPGWIADMQRRYGDSRLFGLCWTPQRQPTSPPPCA